jgi:uncharacterized integral membrane protein
MSETWSQQPYPQPQAVTPIGPVKKEGARNEPAAYWSLVMAILAFFVWFVPAVVAIFMALGAMRNIAASDGYRTGRGFAIAAIVTACAAVVIDTLIVFAIAA